MERKKPRDWFFLREVFGIERVEVVVECVVERMNRREEVKVKPVSLGRYMLLSLLHPVAC